MNQPILELEVAGSHRDSRRAIVPILNGDVEGIKELQVKAAIVEQGQEPVEMGCHYHPVGYKEIYVVISGGPIVWLLYNNNDPQERISISQLPGQRLVIPAGWAHLAIVPPKTIFVGVSSDPYPVDNPSSVDIRVPRESFNW